MLQLNACIEDGNSYISASLCYIPCLRGLYFVQSPLQVEIIVVGNIDNSCYTIYLDIANVVIKTLKPEVAGSLAARHTEYLSPYLRQRKFNLTTEFLIHFTYAALGGTTFKMHNQTFVVNIIHFIFSLSSYGRRCKTHQTEQQTQDYCSKNGFLHKPHVIPP